MKDTLLRLKQDKTIASFYMKREEPDKLRVGYVSELNDEHFITILINRFGEFDGYLLMKINRLFRIDQNGKYEKKIKALQENKNVKLRFLDFQSDDFTTELLEYAKKNKLAVSVELNDSGMTDIQGFIEDVCDSKCRFKILDDYGCEDGNTTCLLSEFTEILCDSTDEALIKTLHALEF